MIMTKQDKEELKLYLSVLIMFIGLIFIFFLAALKEPPFCVEENLFSIDNTSVREVLSCPKCGDILYNSSGVLALDTLDGLDLNIGGANASRSEPTDHYKGERND